MTTSTTTTESDIEEEATRASGQPTDGVHPRSAVLSFRNVHKSYGRTRALRGASFDILPGQVVGLVGANGSGKSTLLKLAAGLLRPTHGSVRMDGRELGRETKARTAYLPEVDHLYNWMTVKQTCDFVRTFYDDWDDDRAAHLLDVLGLEPQKRIGGMSKGQRVRVRLALTFARLAPLVLLDEPLSGIDPPSRTRIINGILAGYRPGEQTVVISTHEVMETEALFDRLMVLSDGDIRLEGNADDLRQRYGKSIRDLLGEDVL